jgi:hypothetical protein
MSKEKTVLTNLIERYERSLIQMKGFRTTTKFEIKMMEAFMKDLRQGLPKEKEQIEEAYDEGVYCNTIGNENNYEDGKQYYSETYETK